MQRELQLTERQAGKGKIVFESPRGIGFDDREGEYNNNETSSTKAIERETKKKR